MSYINKIMAIIAAIVAALGVLYVRILQNKVAKQEEKIKSQASDIAIHETIEAITEQREKIHAKNSGTKRDDVISKLHKQGDLRD